jgi:zinc/manganese transport system ATP-binding protein
VLEVRHLSVRRGSELALEDVSFDLPPASLTALVGPNGAGKSTLLQAIEAQIPVAGGTIRLDGLPLTAPLARQQLALMPQRGEIAWHFPITVRELVGLGRLAASRPGSCCSTNPARPSTLPRGRRC